jgi:sugar lactone lactonase YvrE
MGSRSGLRQIAIAVFVLILVPSAAAAAPVVGTRIPVPGVGTNNKIVEGQDGNLWVTVSDGAKDVARVTPAGAVTEYELKSGASELEFASGIARDAEGRLWVTGEGRVAKFSPADPEGSAAVEDLAQVKAGASIVLGPDGNMWVATTETAIQFPPSKPEPETTRQLFAIAGLLPHDIDVAGSLLAIADQTRIVTLTTAGVQKDYTLGGFSQGVAGLPEGLIAYSEPGSTPQHVGLISPPNLLPPLETPGGIGDPFGVAVGADGAFWFVLGGEGVDRLARLTPSGALTIVDGLPAKTQARQIASGPNNTLWVTLSKETLEGVVPITGLEPPGGNQPPPPPKEPQTQISQGPKGAVKTKRARALVRLRFLASDPAASFECRLLKLAAKKPKASATAPGFVACKSPRSYRLRPGRYRFEVRAVVAGVADKSPAARSFRVVRIASHRHG